MKEVKSNRAWREECEALRAEVEHWKRRALTLSDDQLLAAKVEVLRDAASHMSIASDYAILWRMADAIEELEK